MLRLATTAAPAAGLLLALGGCTVYAPMQPAAPLLCQAGQVEIGASAQLSGRVEATAIYAPRPHLLVAAGLTGCPRLGDHNYLQTLQYEVGAGYYQALDERWVLSGLAGAGQASSRRGFTDVGLIFFPNSYTEYTTHYYKVFGQLGAAYVQLTGAATGVAYRLTHVGFSELREVRLGQLPLPAMLRHELTLSRRTALSANEHWQLASTVGICWSGTARLPEVPQNPAYSSSQYYEANRNLLPAFLCSIGVVYTLRGAGP